MKRGLEAAGKDVPHDLHAEWLAFTFTDNHAERGSERSAWGTYYGPVGGGPGHDGKWIGVPSIEEVTPDVLAYWDRRAREAQHPMLRARYGDVAWDFGRHRNEKVSPDLPRIAIDETIACAERKLFEHSTLGFRQLNRALALALSLRDSKRITAVANAMIAYEAQIAEDRLIGTWGFAFDALVENTPKGVVLPAAVTEKIVADIEARLGRLAQPVVAPKLPDGFAVEAAALPLARHYRRLGRAADVRRVLLIYGNTFVAASENVAANLATGWLERVMEIYRDFGLAEQAEALAVRIRDLGPRRVEEMKPVSSAVEVPAAEVEEYVAAMTAGSLEEVLSRIASKFLPRKDELAKQVERMANLTPFSAMVRREIVDYDGRPVAAIGSVEDDLEGHIVLQAAQTMWMNVPWLREVMERTRFRLHPSAADLRDHLLRSPIFEAGRAPILERGIEAYLDSDPIAAAPILIPQIEHTVRNLLRLSGGSTYKPKRHRNGGLMLKNLDDLMREEAVIRALGEDVAHYFQVLFTDQRGWNIRHDTSHGSLPTEAFTMPMIDRVFHALLILATVRAKEPTPAGGPAPDPAPKKPAAPQKVH